MFKFNKTIISCAVTGGVHTPSMSPYLPITPKQIEDSAVEAHAAGAAVVHLHARLDDGRPTADPAVYGQFVPGIRSRCDAVVNITTGGAPGMTMDERLAAARAMSPDMVSLNMGSINFGFHLMAGKKKDWQYDWEEQFLLESKSKYSVNSFQVLEDIVTELGAEGVVFECECYDIGHLYNLKYLRDQGIIRGPMMVQFIFGFLGGVGVHPSHLEHFYETAERLFGDDYYMSVLAAGRQQMAFGTASACRGGGVRVGLEDALYIRKGELAKSNAEQVNLIAEILDKLNIKLASSTDVREAFNMRPRIGVVA